MKKSARSEAAVTCAHCAKGISKKENGKVVCLCTRVVYCSEACERTALSSGSHVCPGAPPSRVDFNQRMREVIEQGNGIPGGREAFLEELNRTVTSKLRVGQRNGPRRPEISEFVRFAESPDPVGIACAYQAGIAYKQRLFGKIESSQADRVILDTGESELGVLETDELSFKYLKKAAESGLGLAMQSLADSYETGCGVRKDSRACREWYWRARPSRAVWQLWSQRIPRDQIRTRKRAPGHHRHG